jgi:hypothetical protein
MENFLFKTVDIDNIENILLEIRPYVITVADNITKWGFISYDPKVFLKDNEQFSKFISNYNLELTRVAIIKIKPFTNNAIHIDYLEHDRCSLALNMCIENCRNAPTKIYSTNKENTKVSYSETGKPYYSFNQAECKYITEFNLEKPTVFDVAKPHQVCNPTAKRRISISFRFGSMPISLL